MSRCDVCHNRPDRLIYSIKDLSNSITPCDRCQLYRLVANHFHRPDEKVKRKDWSTPHIFQDKWLSRGAWTGLCIDEHTVVDIFLLAGVYPSSS